MMLPAILVQVADKAGGALDAVTPYENWQIVLAFVLPLIISTIIKSRWDQSVQAAAAFGISVVATIIGMYLDGTLLAGGFDVIVTPLKVLPLSIAFYFGWWKPVGATGRIHQSTG